jgi:hypothetical protein
VLSIAEFRSIQIVTCCGFKVVDFFNVCSFSTEPGSAVQLYSVILSEVKRVHKFVLNNVCF